MARYEIIRKLNSYQAHPVEFIFNSTTQLLNILSDFPNKNILKLSENNYQVIIKKIDRSKKIVFCTDFTENEDITLFFDRLSKHL